MASVEIRYSKDGKRLLSSRCSFCDEPAHARWTVFKKDSPTGRDEVFVCYDCAHYVFAHLLADVQATMAIARWGADSSLEQFAREYHRAAWKRLGRHITGCATKRKGM